MAPRRLHLHGSNSVLVAVHDRKDGCYLVYRFDVRRLFTTGDDDDDHRPPREVLPLPPSPVAWFRHPLRRRFLMDLAVSPGPGGDKIVAVTSDGHTMVYDATKSQYTSGPSLRGTKAWPILLASAEEHRRHRGDMLMFAATSEPDYSKRAGPHFEVLRLEAGRLQLLPVPAPLPLFDSLPVRRWRYGDTRIVTCYFVAGGRVWLSLKGEGTYSLDMRRPAASSAWRREGRWDLPLQGRAVYAPDLGLLFGFREGLLFLCAVDIRARPPVIRHEWRSYYGLVPSKQEGYSYDQDTRFCFSQGGLAYLGGGRFCISWYSSYQWRPDGRTLFALTAVQVTRGDGDQLLLRKRRSRCYLLDRYQSLGVEVL